MEILFERRLQRCLNEALADNPVVLLNGARQTGKTTLALNLGEQGNGVEAASYSFDDTATLGAAQNDAAGFLAGIVAASAGKDREKNDGEKEAKRLIVLDEVQRFPALFPALKLWVDGARLRREPHAGRFLLTGSANVLLLPKISESLAGRMEILTLWPLAQSEIENAGYGFIDALFQSPLPLTAPKGNSDLNERILRGGFPEAVKRPSASRRKAWFDSYLNAILQRDVRDISNIEGLTALPRLLQFLATRTAGLLNLSDVSRATTLPYATLNRYMSLLEATFLIHLLPAWSSRLGNRLVKAPKLMLLDTGLASSLIGVDTARLKSEPLLRGALLENFVAVEIFKQVTWSEASPRCYHFRTTSGHEVDLVLETADGRVVGLETKSAATVGADDFKGLRHLAEIAGNKFVSGVVLYGGEKIVPFGERLYAVPLACLWS